MTQPDKLTIDEIERLLAEWNAPSGGLDFWKNCLKQLLDIMRENERLKSALESGKRCCHDEYAGLTKNCPKCSMKLDNGKILCIGDIISLKDIEGATSNGKLISAVPQSNKHPDDKCFHGRPQYEDCQNCFPIQTDHFVDVTNMVDKPTKTRGDNG